MDSEEARWVEGRADGLRRDRDGLRGEVID